MASNIPCTKPARESIGIDLCLYIYMPYILEHFAITENHITTIQCESIMIKYTYTCGRVEEYMPDWAEAAPAELLICCCQAVSPLPASVCEYAGRADADCPLAGYPENICLLPI